MGDGCYTITPGRKCKRKPKKAWVGVLYVILILFGLGWYWKSPGSRPFGPYMAILLILIFLIGWAVFGFVVR